MNDLEKQLREALTIAQAELLPQFEEPSLPAQVLDSLRGRNRGLVVVAFVIATAYLVLAVFAAIRYFHAESTQAMIGWAGGFVFSLAVIGLIKVWYWIELGKNSLAREIKLAQLQLACLTARLKPPDPG